MNLESLIVGRTVNMIPSISKKRLLSIFPSMQGI